MYKILIPEDIAESGKQYLLNRGYEIKVGVPTDTESLKRELLDADGVIIRNAKYPKEVFQESKRLKVIARHGTGTDNIDVKAAEEQGIWVVNGPVANINAVAEFTVGSILMLSAQLRTLDRMTRSKDWSFRLDMKRHEVEGQTLGIIGFGHIGELVAKKVTAGLGMKVLAYDLRRTETELDGVTISADLNEVLAEADFVTLHMPSTDKTRKMFNYQMFHKMKKGSCFINCARGDLYVEDDLVKALEEGYLGGAVLDVYPSEPLRESRLYEFENVILSQHSSGLSEESKDKMSLYAAMGADQVLSGQMPTWPVNHPKTI